MWTTIRAYLGLRTTKNKVCRGSRIDKWIADIKFIEKELPNRHKNLFFKLDEKDFYRQINYLKNNLERLQDDEIITIQKKTPFIFNTIAV